LSSTISAISAITLSAIFVFVFYSFSFYIIRRYRVIKCCCSWFPSFSIIRKYSSIGKRR
jgi:hypothetical protein